MKQTLDSNDANAVKDNRKDLKKICNHRRNNQYVGANETHLRDDALQEGDCGSYQTKLRQQKAWCS